MARLADIDLSEMEQRGDLSAAMSDGSTAHHGTPKMDRKESIDGDRYEFRAYRERLDRLLMRFEMRIKQRLAAVFMQIPQQKGFSGAGYGL